MKVILSVPNEGYSSVPDEGYSSVPDEGSSGTIRIAFIRYDQNNLHQVRSD
jgi:hypothetical protein